MLHLLLCTHSVLFVCTCDEYLAIMLEITSSSQWPALNISGTNIEGGKLRLPPPPQVRNELLICAHQHWIIRKEKKESRHIGVAVSKDFSVAILFNQICLLCRKRADIVKMFEADVDEATDDLCVRSPKHLSLSHSPLVKTWYWHL